MAAACMILPTECWELIFNRVENLEPISLVSKDFLSISSTFRSNLKVYSSSIELLNRLLTRFRCLKKIDLSDFHGDINEAVVEIARLGLKLESLNISSCRKFPIDSLKELGSYMKSLKRLNCCYICDLNDDCLIEIATSLPWLEGIRIKSGHWDEITEDGIEMLVKGLQNLKKIKITADEIELSERLILVLSSNCPFLKKIQLYCGFRTENWFNQLFRLFPNLVSISNEDFLIDSSPLRFVIENSITDAKNLRELHFWFTVISDSTLNAIANVHLPLEVINLYFCRGYSIVGLSTLLRACPSLKILDLANADFIRDEDISSLVPYLRGLTHINLYTLAPLAVSTLFTLLKSCPLLMEIAMNCTRLDRDQEDLGAELSENHQLQTLRLSSCSRSIDEVLKKIGVRCPSLELLNVRRCPYVTNDGIEEAFKYCKKIKHLSTHNGRKIFREDSELLVSSLEVLEVMSIDDANMALIAKICPELRRLQISDSPEVTNKGVMAIVENCTKLREISLIRCGNVTVDIFPLMVTSRPSLRIIHSPWDYSCQSGPSLHHPHWDGLSSIPILQNDLYFVRNDHFRIFERIDTLICNR